MLKIMNSSIQLFISKSLSSFVQLEWNMIKSMRESGISVKGGDSVSRNGMTVPFMLVSGKVIKLMARED